MTTPVNSLFSSGSGPMEGYVDGYAARDFLVSREALARLQQRVDVRKLFIRPNSDPLVRLPQNADDDQLFDAYSARVVARFNILEQIVVLNVSSFKPEDSVLIASSLVRMTEEFADQMNQRARRDALRFSEQELDLAEKRATEARQEMAKWRSDTGIVDPTADVTMLDGLIGQMESQLTAAENDLANIDATGASDHPRRRPLLTEIKTLTERIADTRKRRGGPSGSTTDLISRYEGLNAALGYSENNLTSARQALDYARQAALRQQKYVVVIADPRADGRPTYPNPFTSLLAASIVGVGLAFFGSLIVSMVRSRFAA
ncbi:hypothetical protein [Mesorhizobium sp. 43Arga]